MKYDPVKDSCARILSGFHALGMRPYVPAMTGSSRTTGRTMFSTIIGLVSRPKAGVSRQISAAMIAFATSVASLSAQDVAAIVPAEYLSEYEGLLSDPGNLTRLFQLARRAEVDARRSGSSEGYRFAVRLYERMLLIDRNLTQVSLRLGEIHFRLGEFVEAGSYFRRALEDPDLPEGIRSLAQRYLAEIETELAQSQFTGFLTFGLKYQSNPSLEEEPGLFPTPQGSDFNLYARAGVTHVYDPGLQTGHTFETRLVAATQRYFSLNEINSTSVDLSFGPRFRLDTYGIGATSVRPYLILATDTLDGDWYTYEAGIGVSAIHAPSENIRLSANLDLITKRHNPDQSDFVELETLDGEELGARLSADYRINPKLDLGVSAYWRRRTYPDDTVFSITDRHTNRIGLEVLMQYRHAPLIDFGAGDWVLNLSLGREQARYKTTVAGFPELSREDQENKFMVFSEMPFTSAASIVTGVGYTDYDSTNDFGVYSNWEGFLGFTRRF